MHGCAAGGKEVGYESCTQSSGLDGAMEGSFDFIVGSIARPAGPELRVLVSACGQAACDSSDDACMWAAQPLGKARSQCVLASSSCIPDCVLQCSLMDRG